MTRWTFRNSLVQKISAAMSALMIVGAMLSLGVHDVGAQAVRCLGKDATIVGTNKADRLVGTAGNDVIVSLGGNDTIDGGGGNDRICSGAGNDRVSGGAGNDVINAGAGRDLVEGGAGRDRIIGGGGSDRLLGGAGDDNLKGGGGSDFLEGGDGFDKANGAAGIDVCRAESLKGCDPHRLGAEIERVTQESCSDLSWREGPSEVGGAIYADSLYCENDRVGDDGWVEYDLGRRYKSFRSVVGIDDNSPNSSVTYRFRVFGDGELLSESDVAFGERKVLTTGVRGVLRLRLEVSVIQADGTFDDAIAVWGAPMVTGGAKAPVESTGEVKPLTRARPGTDFNSVRLDSCSDLSWRVDPVTINGSTYSDSLYCENDRVGDDGWLEYNLSRAYTRFTATLGQGDNSVATDVTYRFRVFADDELLYSTDLGFGQSQPIDVDVSNRLRLRLEVEVVAASGGFSDAVAAFGEPVLR